jgi:adenine C2-methylase RlmN of 23S rRNA A2503 and tRNA A37
LEKFVAELPEIKFRSRQLFSWIYQKGNRFCSDVGSVSASAPEAGGCG